MTTNQIAYWEMRNKMDQTAEDKRHNQTTEQETGRHNQATEHETQRSNLAQEMIKWDVNAETKRSNLANEGIKRDTLAETQRSNKANESIKRDTLVETSRANLAQEQLKAEAQAESKRHNQKSELFDNTKLYWDNQARAAVIAAQQEIAGNRTLAHTLALGTANKDYQAAMKDAKLGHKYEEEASVVGTRALADLLSAGGSLAKGIGSLT